MPTCAGQNMIYVHSLGTAVRVTAIFPNDADANAFMEQHSGEGVIAVVGGLVFIARVNDAGMPVGQ